MFLLIFKTMKCNMREVATQVSSINELFMTLVKLRLNLENKDLAYRLGIHNSSVTRIFHKWLDAAYFQFAGLISWPDRESVRGTLSRIISYKFNNLVCIIDCTEIFVERPFGLLARARTFSNYKNTTLLNTSLGLHQLVAYHFYLQDGEEKFRMMN